MKSILYLDHTAKLGGGEIAILNLIMALDKTRFRPIALLASDGPLVHKLRSAGVETHVMPISAEVVDTRKDKIGASTLLQLSKVFAVVQYARRVAAWARANKIDLIHTNSLKSDVYGGLAGRMARIPVLWHVRDNINSQYLPGPVAAIFRLLAGIIPQVVIANSESTLSTLNPPRGKRSAAVYSGIVTGEATEIGEVVHDGIADAFAREHTASSRAGGADQTIALIGRIAPWKGQHIFLQAAAQVLRRYPSACFLIVGAPLFGEEEYETSLHDLVGSLGIRDNVEFLGFRDDVRGILEGVDIVVHASTVGEPFGQVVVEGMAAGKPVIATDGGALPEIIDHGKTGLLVPMGDPGQMAQAIESLLDSPEWAATIAMAGRNRALNTFTIAHTAAKIEAIYDGVFATSRNRSPMDGSASEPSIKPQAADSAGINNIPQ